MRPHRIKNGEGIVGGVRRFFEANPDEELTYSQMATKFDATQGYCREVVKLLRKRGMSIESVHIVRVVKKAEATK